MYKYAKLIRLFLASLGLFTVLVSSTVIFHAVTFLSSQPQDALLYVSIVALLLGIFLALGGACLALRGAKYNEYTTDYTDCADWPAASEHSLLIAESLNGECTLHLISTQLCRPSLAVSRQLINHRLRG